MKESLLSANTIAERTDSSAWTVRDWWAKGYLPSVLLGGRRFTTETALNRFLADAIKGRGPLSQGHNRGRAAADARRGKTATPSAD